MNILIADDNATNLKLLRAQLEAEGHRVFPAADGAEALTVLEREPIQAVFSDILMPRIDGYRLCMEVRKSEKFKDLPFIIYTSTYTSPSDEKAALDLGADRFLKKPASRSEVICALQDSKGAARRRPRPQLPARELDLMKEYSERLVAKLESKNLKLEAQARALRQSEEELRKSHGQFRALAGRLQISLEEERMRIAREMHDGMGEMLSGIEMGLAWMRALLEPARRRFSRKELLEKIETMDALAIGTAERVRKLCTELRPSILDDLGLVAAIEWQGHEFQARTNLRCEMKLADENLAPSPDQATALFRISQEILTNVARHAHASRVRVLLRKHGANLILEVRDNGKGIRPEQLAGSKSLGLLGMQERAGMLGGHVAIHGRPGKGTTVTVTIPVATPDAHSLPE